MDQTNQRETANEEHAEGGVPFFPDHFVKEMSVMALVAAGVWFLATLMPMPMGEPADPLKTPPGIKPEWYFLAVYQILKYVPKNPGIVFTMLIFPPWLMLFPFTYRWYSKYAYGRLIMHTIAALGVLTAFFLSALAYLVWAAPKRRWFPPFWAVSAKLLRWRWSACWLSSTTPWTERPPTLMGLDRSKVGLSSNS